MPLEGSPWWGLKGALFLGAVLDARQRASCPWRSLWENNRGPKGALKWSLKGTCGEHRGQPAGRRGFCSGQPQGGPKEASKGASIVAIPGAGCGMSNLWIWKRLGKGSQTCGTCHGRDVLSPCTCSS